MVCRFVGVFLKKGYKTELQNSTNPTNATNHRKHKALGLQRYIQINYKLSITYINLIYSTYYLTFGLHFALNLASLNFQITLILSVSLDIKLPEPYTCNISSARGYLWETNGDMQ